MFEPVQPFSPFAHSENSDLPPVPRLSGLRSEKRDLEGKGHGAKEAIGRDLRRLALC